MNSSYRLFENQLVREKCEDMSICDAYDVQIRK